MRFLIYEEVPFIVYPRLVPFGTRVQVTGQKIASRPVLFFVVLGIFLFVFFFFEWGLCRHSLLDIFVK